MLSMAVALRFWQLQPGYTVGVVSQNNVIAQIDVNIGSIETYLEKNHNATQLLDRRIQRGLLRQNQNHCHGCWRRTVRSSPMTGRWKNCVSQSTPI